MKSQKGNAILLALIGALGMSGLFFVVQAMNQSTDKSQIVTRTKAIMGMMEQRVRTLAFQPTTYTGCNSAGGSTSCTLDQSKLNALRLIRVPGAVCAAGVPGCGIELTNISFNPGSRVFKATLKFTGKNGVLSPADIQIDVPEDVLQAQSYDCGAIDSTKPLFKGFDSSGRPICEGLPSCGIGEFVSGIDPATLQPVCRSIPSSLGCPSDQFISSINWSGGSNITVSCQHRMDPFSLWPL